MADGDETNKLLREIRDLLADRERQYAAHLQDVRDMYNEQLLQARQERERAINRLSLAAAIIGAIAFGIYLWLK
jgi:hypothetical protein